LRAALAADVQVVRLVRSDLFARVVLQDQILDGRREHVVVNVDDRHIRLRPLASAG